MHMDGMASQVRLLEDPEQYEAFQLSHDPNGGALMTTGAAEKGAAKKAAVATRVSFLLCYMVRLIEMRASKGKLDEQVSREEVEYFLATAGLTPS